ncbi:MAG: beta-ketoacyl synthase chain length factor [Janthinobacterium lividum]
MSGLRAVVRGVSVWGPGLEGWAASRAVLAGDAAYVARDSPPPPPAILAGTERRRAGPVVRLALAVAQEAALGSGLAPGSLRSVFGSSNGDGIVVGGILDAMARGEPGERVVSPTQFHNSVHNAAAGYWSIAHGSRQPATCLGAHDWTWAASLLKAMVEVAASGEAVLLCCYDHPLPPPLDVLRPTVAAFGAGLVLAPDGDGPVLRVSLERGAAVEAGLPPGLEALAAGNTAARALPLLAGLARGGGSRHGTAYLEGHLAVSLEAGSA